MGTQCELHEDFTTHYGITSLSSIENTFAENEK